MSKLTMQPNGGSIVGASGSLLGTEKSKMDIFSIHGDITAPLASLFMPTDALKSARVMGPHPSILAILGACTFAKIFPSIVQRVCRTMVTLFIWVTSDDEPVHVDFFTAFRSTYGVKAIFTFAGAPIKFRKPMKIIEINNGVFTFCEWNNPVRCSGWLSNKMPIHPAFLHMSSLKDLCYSAIVT